MKILILIIYSNNDENNKEIYEKMLKIQRSYINNFDGVSSYFIQMSEDQYEQIVMKDDFIFVKGKETLMNIMHKTIESMNYLFNTLGCDYNYILRTNISTIVNIPKLIEYCQILPEKNIYTGGSILNLNWLDYKSGIIDTSLFGTEYVAGTCIILSKDVVIHIINNKMNIRYDVIDDLSFGIYIKNYIQNAIENLRKYKIEKYVSIDKIILDDNIEKDTIIFRNRYQCVDPLYNRITDIYNMQKIKKYIYC
jgi:hypothetical protein